MMADWAKLKGWAEKAVKLSGEISGAAALVNDAWNSYSDYKKCRSGHS
jgi:hypothetical protein